MSAKHLLFYDGDCPFCYRAILEILKSDDKKLFVFAPLNGQTAKEILIGPNAHYAREESLVLVESYRTDERRFWLRFRGAFRIYWLMGSCWIGWLSFLPAWMGDWAYRWVAKHRHRLCFRWERKEFEGERFLP